MSTTDKWDAVIADLRRPGGWMQRSYGAWYEPEGAVCLGGAMMRHYCNDLGLIDRLLDIVTEQFPDRPTFYSVTAFNDHPDTTLDDVLLVCEKVRASFPLVEGAPKP